MIIVCRSSAFRSVRNAFRIVGTRSRSSSADEDEGDYDDDPRKALVKRQTYGNSRRDSFDLDSGLLPSAHDWDDPAKQGKRLSHSRGHEDGIEVIGGEDGNEEFASDSRASRSRRKKGDQQR